MGKVTYKQAGVDIGAADAVKKKIAFLAKRSFRKGAIKDIGGFGGFFAFPSGLRQPVLVSSADGVGTKLKIAVLSGRHNSVGIDAVAMNVNDILCAGAEPLFFLDYIAYSSLPENTLIDIVKGINRGCMLCGCSLIGGETAQMPAIYRPGEYDLAGFCVGVVEKKDIIDGSKIAPGDTIIGLASSGLHSNGYSLVRRALSPKELKVNIQKLLVPTRIYVKPVLALLRSPEYAGKCRAINGIAHITGGAFYDKIARILPDNVGARIFKGSWKVPDIFRLIQNKAAISDEEIYHTLNMGIGMVLFVRRFQAKAVISRLADFKVNARIIGETVKGTGRVQIV